MNLKQVLSTPGNLGVTAPDQTSFAQVQPAQTLCSAVCMPGMLTATPPALPNARVRLEYLACCVIMSGLPPAYLTGETEAWSYKVNCSLLTVVPQKLMC